MTDQTATTNLYVAPLNDDELGWSSLTLHDYVVKLGRYFHPVAHGFPR